MVEHGTHNPLVVGSSPSGPIFPSSRFAAERGFLFGRTRIEPHFSEGKIMEWEFAVPFFLQTMPHEAAF